MTIDSEFHNRRRLKLGASEAAKVMGLSPFGNALDVYNYKLGLVTGNMGMNLEAINRGNRQEAFVLTEFAAKHNVEVRNQQLAVSHPEPSLAWASATLDGVAYSGFKPLGPVEAKTITTGLYLNNPPVHYLIQVLWQCWVTGFPEGWLAVWSTKDNRFADYHIKVEDHAELLEQAIEICTRFWHDNVLAQVPPEPPPKRERETKDDLNNEQLEKYVSLGTEIRRLEDLRDKTKRCILESLDYPEELHVENHLFKVDVTKTAPRRPGHQPGQKIVVTRVGVEI